MDQGVRWAIAFAVALFIVLLIVFARGEPFHAEPTAPPTAAAHLLGAIVR